MVGTDGSTTKYTYTPLGQIATEIDFAGTSQSTKTTYVYDAAGNVVKQTVQPVDSSGNPIVDPDTGSTGGIVNTYAYDAQGRLTQEVDTYIPGSTDPTANKTTTYAYSQSNNENITTVTNPDTSTNVTKTFLDGTNAGNGGTDQPADYSAEGVIASDTTDTDGNDETAGSTYVVTNNSAGQQVITYTNILERVYLAQQSDSSTSSSCSLPRPTETRWACLQR